MLALEQQQASKGKSSLLSEACPALASHYARHAWTRRHAARWRGRRQLTGRGGRQDDMEQRVATVDLTGKHIVECEALEKRRYQSRSGNRQVFLNFPEKGSRHCRNLALTV